MRVIGGELRGRRLAAPVGAGVRPTTDRVREAIFDVLFSLGGVEGLQVADLFAGSGALGIEALSRGAASVTFVDRDPLCLAAIRRNLESVGLDDGERSGDATVVRADVDTWVATTASRYDLVLCDPPYDYDRWPALVAQLPADLAVLESDIGDRPTPWLGSHQNQALWRYDRDRCPPGTGRQGRCHVRIALIPGSFDPVHNGHLEVIERAARLFDEVVVATLRNPQKSEALFELEERQEMLEESLGHLVNVRIVSVSTLVVNVAHDVGASAIVKGLTGGVRFRERAADGPDEQAALGGGDPVHPHQFGPFLHRLAAVEGGGPVRRRRHILRSQGGGPPAAGEVLR